MAIGNQIRDVIEDAGLEPDLRAHVGEEHGFDDEVLPNVRNVIAVSSGKGGVGKTTVAANLAAGLEKRGAMVGLLDADIHGPNVPQILPPESDPGVTPNEEIVPPRSDGVRVISMGMMMEDDDDPAILRGPMVNKFMMKFLEGVEWGRLDYLIVDLPPGTGDATLNLLQSMPVTGSVVVTTPQEMALDDTRKGIQMFNKHDTPVFGVVENMSSFICPSCGDQHGLFGTGGADTIVDKYDVPLLGKIPIHPDFGADGSEGRSSRTTTARSNSTSRRTSSARSPTESARPTAVRSRKTSRRNRRTSYRPRRKTERSPTAPHRPLQIRSLFPCCYDAVRRTETQCSIRTPIRSTTSSREPARSRPRNWSSATMSS